MISMDYSPIIIVPWKKWAVEAIIAHAYSLFPSKIKRIGGADRILDCLGN